MYRGKYENKIHTMQGDNKVRYTEFRNVVPSQQYELEEDFFNVLISCFEAKTANIFINMKYINQHSSASRPIYMFPSNKCKRLQ